MAKAEYRSAIRSKKLIIMALADLLQEKPLDKITVTEIVRRADINRGTFYAHYTDIPDVLHHLIADTFLKIRDVIFDTPLRSEDFPHLLLSAIQEILETEWDLCQKVMTSSASTMMEEELVKLVLDYMIQHEDFFSGGDRQRFILTIRFCAGGLSTLYREWFYGNIPLTLDELTEAAEEVLRNITAGRSVK